MQMRSTIGKPCHTPRTIPCRTTGQNRRRLTAVLMLLLAFPLFLSAQARHTLSTQRDSGISIVVEPAFEKLPNHGYAPLRITIDNNSGREQSWQFEFNSSSYAANQSGTYRSQSVFTVADNDGRHFDVVVPVRSAENYGYLTINALGYGVSSNATVNLHSDFARHSPRGGAYVIGPHLAPHNLGRLDNHGAMAGTSMTLNLAPNDWRGYSAFDSIWLSDNDWEELEPTQRQAILDWTATGGYLYLCREEGDTTVVPGLPVRSLDAPQPHGFGQISSFPRDGVELDIDEARDLIHDAPDLKDELNDRYDSSSWALLDYVGTMRISSIFFIAFLVIFAVVIGPVNVFVFAPANKRYRLFWTTPALSLGASLVIFVLILTQDGTGGTGARQVAWFHIPSLNKAAFAQEQTTRTSLLLNRSFDLPSEAMISTVRIPAEGSLGPGSLSATGTTYGGDWFQSRNIQGHLIEGVKATRWRIEIASLNGGATGEAPEIVSTFPFQLDRLYFRDDDGQVWKGENVTPGNRVSLEPEDSIELEIAWQTFSQESGPSLERRISGHDERPGYFYAFLEDEPESSMPTLDAITWNRSRSLHFGPVVTP